VSSLGGITDFIGGLPVLRGTRTSSGWTTGSSLHQRFDPRSNSLSMLRLILATTVAIVHAQAIGWDDQPTLGRAQIGDLAVDGFFVISGFLVTRSAVRLPTLRRFVWHRALRILPGFWTCLAVTALLIAPLRAWLQGRPIAGVFSGQDSAPAFVVNNAALLIRQWGISELDTGQDPLPMNGALWTLFYEALCYLAVGLLVAVGLLKVANRSARLRLHRDPANDHRPTAARTGATRLAGRVRRHALLPITLAVWLMYVGQLAGILPASPQHICRFLWMFLLGALGHVYADRIRFTIAGATAGGITFLIAVFLFELYQFAAGPGFAYLLLWAVVGIPLRWEPPADLSYGMYVYHWPTALVLNDLQLTGAGRFAFTIATVAIVGVLAAASWYVVEAPALRHKNDSWVEWRRHTRTRGKHVAQVV
jgi:peptidoglycan/LPS O-acetylase OafA/YrhL